MRRQKPIPRKELSGPWIIAEFPTHQSSNNLAEFHRQVFVAEPV